MRHPPDERFATLRLARRIWALPSIHAEAERLRALHDQLEPRIQRGDRLVYLGNMIGRGRAVRETVRELLLFRRAILARLGMEPEDIVFLRGAQEEMWQKLLQIHLAPNPGEVLRWMFDQGVAETLLAYGGSPQEALAVARQGAAVLARWTTGLRAAVRREAGHEALAAALRRAASTDDGRLLFVNAGIDPKRPMTDQRDRFWWDRSGFEAIREPYAGFARVVRGYDAAHAGLQETPHSVSLDAGCGFGGPLIAACFAPGGEILELLEA